MIKVNVPFICIIQEDASGPHGWSVETENGDKCFVTFTKNVKPMRGDRIYVTPSFIKDDRVGAIYSVELCSKEQALLDDTEFHTKKQLTT